MRTMDELNHLFLYSANKKVYAPIDEKDKRKNSAILLLTPDLNTSLQLTKLPYLYNPNLFTSFYISRDVNAYIKNISDDELKEFDEEEAKSLSEAMIYWTGKTKFKFDDHTSTMDEKYIRDVFNHEAVSYYAKMLRLNKVPDKINIIVHPNLTSLRKNAPKQITSIYKDSFYAYIDNSGNINLLSKMVYDPESMCGDYNIYLTSELLYALMTLYNKYLPAIPTRAIALAIAGLEEWMKKEKRNTIEGNDAIKFMHVVNVMREKHGMKPIHEFIKNADINVFTKYTIKNTINTVSSLIFESELSYFERQRLLPSDFAIPEKRKYPIHDEYHVRAAVRMFNNCDPADEEELAAAIIKRMKKFGITDIKVSASNRFRKYYKNSTSKNESAVEEDNGYDKILKICSSLSDNELRRITFTDSYEDSKFVIKRIICKVGTEPAGFLDVYHFPSNPKLAQIVIAVDSKFRGMGVAQSMVSEMFASELHKNYDFDMYYWTAHVDNYASQNLAIKNGFIDSNIIDKYGRKVFVKNINKSTDNTVLREATSISNENINSINIDNCVFFFEADNPAYSQKLRNYLYSERIKTNKEVSLIYDKVKENNPDLRKMYLKIKMYKKQNVFVDLSYYHGLFLKNNKYTMDKGLQLYFDFLNKLIENKEIDQEYSKKTIFIPIDNGIWPTQPGTDPFDYRKNINPISLIFRFVRTNLHALRTAWGNKNIIFVGSRGYFTIDFNKFELKELSRLKVNLRKLTSSDEVIEDDYELDEVLEDDPKMYDSMSKRNTDTSKGRAIRMIDRLEYDSNIKIDNISAINSIPKSDSSNKEFIKSTHLRISNSLELNKKAIAKDNGIVIISIDPDGPNGFKRLNKTPLSNIDGTVTTYCLPD